MPNERSKTTLAASCLALAFVAGCGEGSLSVADATPAAEAEEPKTAAPQPAEAVAAATPPQNRRPQKPTPKPAPKYRPPFPGRTELFNPPRNARRTAQRSNDGNYEESVELMGFVRIDGPHAEQHAVLSIDGVVTPVPLGHEREGVQVISIQPPVAVLQRGRSRWTATLD
ncbi:MAG: hypothetical protein AAGG46_10725 [Planctomycetota bacterium]